MKTHLNILLLSLGLIIASISIMYIGISAQHILITGGILFVTTLLLSIVKHNINTNSKPRKSSVAKTINHTTENTIKGTVKWFNKTKGFGFITQSNGDDVFVHQTSLAFKGGVLKEGQSVTMQVIQDEKGPQAENVKRA